MDELINRVPGELFKDMKRIQSIIELIFFHLFSEISTFTITSKR